MQARLLAAKQATKNKARLAEPVRGAWEEALFASGHFFPIDLTREIVRSAETLYEIAERGDRLIAATAMVLECPLITRDPQIAAAASIAAVW